MSLLAARIGFPTTQIPRFRGDVQRMSQCAIGGNIRLKTFTTPPPTKFGGAFFNVRRGGSA